MNRGDSAFITGRHVDGLAREDNAEEVVVLCSARSGELGGVLRAGGREGSASITTIVWW